MWLENGANFYNNFKRENPEIFSFRDESLSLILNIISVKLKVISLKVSFCQ